MKPVTISCEAVKPWPAPGWNGRGVLRTEREAPLFALKPIESFGVSGNRRATARADYWVCRVRCGIAGALRQGANRPSLNLVEDSPSTCRTCRWRSYGSGTRLPSGSPLPEPDWSAVPRRPPGNSTAPQPSSGVATSPSLRRLTINRSVFAYVQGIFLRFGTWQRLRASLMPGISALP